MIKGMTGFGCCSIASCGLKGNIEIKTLNHRYLDINFYLPAGFLSIENKLRDIVQKKIERGKVTVSLKILNKCPDEPSINKEIIKKYMKCFNELLRDFKFSDNLGLCDILKLPGVLEIKETSLDPELLFPALDKSLHLAISELERMRKREGNSLFIDISDQLKQMLLEIKNIQNRSAFLLKEKRKILLKEEFISFQKSNDINEEISRLTHFIVEFKALIRSNLSIGKKLDFIAQEMQRETNTIGSKIQDSIVSNSVISLKSKVEKIREQVQNVE